MTGDNLNIAEYHNESIAGVSLFATVSTVERDTVQVAVDGDENKTDCGARPFPYATVYSSADGTGWYVMPEKGDAVRLYFPNENEKNAYAASSTHLETGNRDERVNPDSKSLMNKHGKEIQFTPDSLVITNNAGMSVEILDNVGIRIISDKAISIASDDMVSVVSTGSAVQVVASEAITLKQGETSITLSDLAKLSGAQVRIE